jgi:hypothetical protein
MPPTPRHYALCPDLVALAIALVATVLLALGSLLLAAWVFERF